VPDAAWGLPGRTGLRTRTFHLSDFPNRIDSWPYARQDGDAHSGTDKIRGDDGADPQAPVALNPLPVGDVYWL